MVDHLAHGLTRLSYRDCRVELSPSPVCVSVSLADLARLCLMAREAGEDMQAAAWRDYPGDLPSNVRRRTNEINAALEMIGAANAFSSYQAT
jgi:hypothetical protein